MRSVWRRVGKASFSCLCCRYRPQYPVLSAVPVHEVRVFPVFPLTITLGRVIIYTLLGIVLILILKEGSSLFGIQKFIGKYGELVLGPALLLIGLFILFGGKLKLPSFGFKGNGEGLARKGGWGAFLLGVLFAMAFCPTSGVFYFGILIPMSATTVAGYLLPVLLP